MSKRERGNGGGGKEGARQKDRDRERLRSQNSSTNLELLRHHLCRRALDRFVDDRSALDGRGRSRSRSLGSLSTERKDRPRAPRAPLQQALEWEEVLEVDATEAVGAARLGRRVVWQPLVCRRVEGGERRLGLGQRYIEFSARFLAPLSSLPSPFLPSLSSLPSPPSPPLLSLLSLLSLPSLLSLLSLLSLPPSLSSPSAPIISR